MSFICIYQLFILKEKKRQEKKLHVEGRSRRVQTDRKFGDEKRIKAFYYYMFFIYFVENCFFVLVIIV